jgi:hypothetical protein
MSSATSQSVSLTFPLVVEDNWPPFASETLPFEACGQGYRLLTAPLFVRELSVDDVLEVELADKNEVES